LGRSLTLAAFDCWTQDKVHVVEMRLGIRIPPSPRQQWKRAALLVRTYSVMLNLSPV
jgi:hypothetical protein